MQVALALVFHSLGNYFLAFRFNQDFFRQLFSVAFSSSAFLPQPMHIPERRKNRPIQTTWNSGPCPALLVAFRRFRRFQTTSVPLFVNAKFFLQMEKEVSRKSAFSLSNWRFRNVILQPIAEDGPGRKSFLGWAVGKPSTVQDLLGHSLVIFRT